MEQNAQRTFCCGGLIKWPEDHVFEILQRRCPFKNIISNSEFDSLINNLCFASLFLACPDNFLKMSIN